MADQTEKVAKEEIIQVDDHKAGLEESLEDHDQEMGHEEEPMAVDPEEAIQAAIALTVRAWLEEHGTKLFALEFSKKRVRAEREDVKKAVKASPTPKYLQKESTLGERQAKRKRLGPKPL